LLIDFFIVVGVPKAVITGIAKELKQIGADLSSQDTYMFIK